MAHSNNPIVPNKTHLQEILSADPQFILDKVREKELITSREYTKLNSINKGDAEDLVIKLVDTINNKGVQSRSQFIELLQDEIVLETYPRLRDVEWGDSGTASSSSLKHPAETSLSKDGPPEFKSQKTFNSDSGTASSSSSKRPAERRRSIDLPPEFMSQKTEGEYLFTSKPTGLCVIINNKNFHDEKNNRSGTEKEAEDLSKVFSWLGFQVLMCQDLTASNMAQVTKLLADLKDLEGLQKCKLEEWSADGRFTPLSVLPRHGDAFVCCVLSNGADNVVLGVDDEPLTISDITSAFNGEHCPALLGKPKVFFIQACQGHSLQPGLAVDDVIYQRTMKEDYIPIEADFLVFISTVAKYQSLRDPSSGSFFIQSLCEQLRQGCARGEDILTILARVNDDVRKKDFGIKQDPEKKVLMPEIRNMTLLLKLVFRLRKHNAGN